MFITQGVITLVIDVAAGGTSFLFGSSLGLEMLPACSGEAFALDVAIYGTHPPSVEMRMIAARAHRPVNSASSTVFYELSDLPVPALVHCYFAQ
jgi:hypothetical protein